MRVCVCACVLCNILRGGGAGGNSERLCGRKTELLPSFQSYIWQRGGDSTKPSPRCMLVSNTDAPLSYSLRHFSWIGKRTATRVCSTRRVFTLAAQRTGERVFASLQLHSLDQLRASAPRRAALPSRCPWGARFPRLGAGFRASRSGQA